MTIFARQKFFGIRGLKAGANPTIVSDNSSAVIIYNANRSLVHYENKNIFYILKTL
jgi:hypothetical protein